MYRLLYFLIFSCNIFVAQANGDVWLSIDTTNKTLQVKKGANTVETFTNIALGRAGPGQKTQRGDNVTPLGIYKIGWINRDSQFHVFYGFDYPSLLDAQQGRDNGLISRDTYHSVIKAHQNQQVPPQNTVLGGQLGIHGLGNADPRVHEFMDWTRGCIALTDPQIDQLDKWIEPGIVVEIK